MHETSETRPRSPYLKPAAFGDETPGISTRYLFHISCCLVTSDCQLLSTYWLIATIVPPTTSIHYQTWSDHINFACAQIYLSMILSNFLSPSSQPIQQAPESHVDNQMLSQTPGYAIKIFGRENGPDEQVSPQRRACRHHRP